MTTPFLTVEEAQVYFDGRLNTEAWDDASDTDKLKSLIHATRLINRLSFVGQKSDPYQENEFPRGLGTLIPESIQHATCEIAIQLLDGVEPELEVTNIGATSRGYGPTATNYDRSFVLANVRAGIPSTEAWQLLLPYLQDPLAIKIYRK